LSGLAMRVRLFERGVRVATVRLRPRRDEEQTKEGWS
jgi:hypothetical protein